MNKADSKTVVVTNRSKQMIPIQVKPPRGDFFYEEQQVRLGPGKSVSVPKGHLNWAQIENCRGRGDVSVIEEK